MILPSAIILPLPEPVNNFVDQSTNKLKNNTERRSPVLLDLFEFECARIQLIVLSALFD